MPTDTDFYAMPYEDQADWLAAHFTAHGLPARAVAMGGPCYSAQIAIVLDGDRRHLNLQWEETLRWQTEDPEAIEYLDEGTLEDLTPDQSASRVWSWLAANGAKVALTPGPPSPAAADLETMSEQARADWLAGHLSANGIPCKAVGMGGSAVSVEVPVAFDDVPYRLYLAWEDGILWQVEPRDGGEVPEHGLWWALAPEESTDHVRDWLISRGGRLALPGLASARPDVHSSSEAAEAAVAPHRPRWNRSCTRCSTPSTGSSARSPR
ncbi:hypothetical protein ACIGXM_25335 [Kitasatospora sp. NPDC052896]|uniref:hypothetical protein n=1 Tax=Kitasatospora sp. NPDC052896 TaxID=3364061 RepID=UPI0037C8D3B3